MNAMLNPRWVSLPSDKKSGKMKKNNVVKTENYFQVVIITSEISKITFPRSLFSVSQMTFLWRKIRINSKYLYFSILLEFRDAII